MDIDRHREMKTEGGIRRDSYRQTNIDWHRVTKTKTKKTQTEGDEELGQKNMERDKQDTDTDNCRDRQTVKYE